MRNLFSSIAVLSALALPMAALADTFSFDFVVSGASSVGSLTTTSNGNGSETITGITGTYFTEILQPGRFNNNDNLLFPHATSLVDNRAVAFTGVIFDTGFVADIFSTGRGTYAVSFSDQGYDGAYPVGVEVENVTQTPEPGSLILLGTGICGLFLIAGLRQALKADRTQTDGDTTR